MLRELRFKANAAGEELLTYLFDITAIEADNRVRALHAARPAK